MKGAPLTTTARTWVLLGVPTPLTRRPAPRHARPSAVSPVLRRGLGWAGNLGVALVLLAFLGLAVGPQTGLYRTTTMLTGSMRPAYPPGSVLLLTREPVSALAPGHVVTFHAPTEDRRVVTHRLVSIDRSGERPVMVTKGDANPGVDPWRAAVNGETVWRVRAVIPQAGTAIRLMRDPLVQLLLTRWLPGLLLLVLLVSVWRPEPKNA